MEIVKETLSPQLYELFTAWIDEYYDNVAHDTNETKAWNALVIYLMELEKPKT